MKKVLSTVRRKFPFPVPINVNGRDPCEKDQKKNDERETVLKGDVQSKHLTSNAQRSTSKVQSTNREQSWEIRGSIQPFNILFWQADAAHEVGEARIGAEVSNRENPKNKVVAD